jgi:hypothetical protein
MAFIFEYGNEVSDSVKVSFLYHLQDIEPIHTPILGALGHISCFENISTINMSFKTADKWWFSSLGLGLELTIPHCKKKTVCYEMLHRTSEFAGVCEHSNEP